MKTPNIPGYQTKAELAWQLAKSQRTLDRWHERGEGPRRTRLGRTVLYKRETVDEWLQANEEGARRRKRQ
jgi:predicted DNA-binding transcriptional regulator AlpA